MSARTGDGTFITVNMVPTGRLAGNEGGRAVLTCDEARSLRDDLSAALEIDDLRRAAAEAQDKLTARLAA